MEKLCKYYEHQGIKLGKIENKFKRKKPLQINNFMPTFCHEIDGLENLMTV